MTADGFERYLRLHGAGLLRFAVTLTGDAGLAEEVVQNVLLRAFQRWDTINNLDLPHAYIRRMIVNEHLSWRRRWSRVQPCAEVEPHGVIADETGGRDEHAALVSELLRLPRKQRAVLAMRYFEDLPDVEIAHFLGCSTATVRSLAARGLSKLRVNMTDTDTRHLAEEAAR